MAMLSQTFPLDVPGFERKYSADSKGKNTPYLRLLQRLHGLSAVRPVGLGLARLKSALEELERPDRRYAIVHVGGTNGKGSVATKIATALTRSGYQTGLFTSPHLHTFRERVVVNGEMVSEELCVTLLERLFVLVETRGIQLSFFEMMTLFALQLFAKRGVEVAVIEVGLGGRLDATNLVEPILSVITSIGWDHMALLGRTREQIAKEKAGIIKPQVPLVLGPRARNLGIEDEARRAGSPCTLVGRQPDYLEENRLIAAKALELLGAQMPMKEEAIGLGLRALPPCRFEQVMPGLLLDVAHNVSGVQQLFEAIERRMKPQAIRVLVSLSQGKDDQAILKALHRFADAVHVVDAVHERLMPYAKLAARALAVGFRPATPSGPIDEVLPALYAARKEGELLVVCGSFFIMDAARFALDEKQGGRAGPV